MVKSLRSDELEGVVRAARLSVYARKVDEVQIRPGPEVFNKIRVGDFALFYRVEVEGVIVEAANQDILTLAAGQGIITIAALELVVGIHADQVIGAAETLDV